MTSLKPCPVPWCSRKAEPELQIKSPFRSDARVVCPSCRCETPWKKSADQAAAAWNERPGVGVKPLEWHYDGEPGFDSWYAESLVGSAAVYPTGGKWRWRHSLGDGRYQIGLVDTPEAAKAAAEAVYVSRIQAHLTPAELVNMLERGESIVEFMAAVTNSGLADAWLEDVRALLSKARLPELAQVVTWIPVAKQLPDGVKFLHVASDAGQIFGCWFKWQKFQTDATITHWAEPLLHPSQLALEKGGVRE